MLVLILIAVWIAILAPVVIRRLRDRDTDRSIVSFHERMAKLGERGDPIVEPAHRLETAHLSATAPPAQLAPEPYAAPMAAPRLRIVPDGATQAQLNRDMSWDEWSSQYLDEPTPVRPDAPATHEAPLHRAAAYSHVPTAPPLTSRGPVTTARAQRARRRQILFAIIGTAVASSVLALVVSFWMIEMVAFVSWVGLLVYLGLMYYAMSLGMIDSASRSRSVRLVNPRVDAVRVDSEPDERWAVGSYNEFDYAYEPEPRQQFQRYSDDEYARAL